MCPRPRKVDDDEIFAAAARAMQRKGPGELTLADIAAEAGLTASALVQRFGSRRALLLALTEKVSASASDLIAALRARHRTPLATLRAYGDCMAGLASSPAALARNLAYLQIDLTDADFRRHLARQARATRAGLVALVREAVEAGELRRCDAHGLARVIEAVLSGSMLVWGFYRRGRAAAWMRRDLEAVLAPYVGKRGPAPRR